MRRPTCTRAAGSPSRHRRHGTADRNERAFALVLRGLEADRRTCLQIAISTALKAGFPTLADFTGNADGAGLSHARLPIRGGSTSRSLSHRRPGRYRCYRLDRGCRRKEPVFLGVLALAPLRIARQCSICGKSSFGRTTWPCRAIRVGLTTSSKSRTLTGLRDCAAHLNTHLKEGSYDARYSKVVQRPKRLRLYPA
jgi:hypothetical protein